VLGRDAAPDAIRKSSQKPVWEPDHCDAALRWFSAMRMARFCYDGAHDAATLKGFISVLDARAKTIAEILHSGDQYLIPFFQRTYSWESRHWQRILADVDALAETAADRLHFLGPLVCAPTAHVPGEVTSYQLIDGQQRITTVTLMLAALSSPW
jgi:Protein of unknown function DUF262